MAQSIVSTTAYSFASIPGALLKCQVSHWIWIPLEHVDTYLFWKGQMENILRMTPSTRRFLLHQRRMRMVLSILFIPFGWRRIGLYWGGYIIHAAVGPSSFHLWRTTSLPEIAGNCLNYTCHHANPVTSKASKLIFDQWSRMMQNPWVTMLIK